jgi:putative oxidoreductase
MRFLARLEPFARVPVVNLGEPAVLYCLVFLFIATRGGGRFGLDRALRRD